MIREKVRAGGSDDQMRRILVARYGEYVLMKPPLRLGLALWGGPFLLVGLGAGLLLTRLRTVRPKSRPNGPEEASGTVGSRPPDMIAPATGRNAGKR